MSNQSQLMEMIGLGNLDFAYLFIGIAVLFLILIVLMIIQLVKYRKLRKRYEKFMQGKEAKSLESDILKLFEEQKQIKKDNEKNRKDIKELFRNTSYCYQKLGVVKYDAFKEMGGKLSFCIVMLNEKNDGFLLNSVHSTDGCYTYVKEVVKGECALSLGEEEAEALKQAVGF